MSDFAVVVRCTSAESDGSVDAAELERLLVTLTETIGAGFRNSLREEASWSAIPPDMIVVFEYWGEAADSLVEGPEGEVTEAAWTTVTVNGEEVDMPEIPEGSPPGEELLERLLAADLRIVEARLAEVVENLPTEFLFQPEIVRW